MRLVTWNEKNNPDLPAWQVTHDCGRMARLFRRRRNTIICGQEFGERADRHSLEAAFPDYDVYGAYPTPILVPPRDFKVLDSGHVWTHGPLAGISPDRGFSWVLAKKRRRPFVRPFIVIGEHRVSGAWTAEPRKAQEWRREMWKRHHAKVVAFIAQWNAKGTDVYDVGDMNRVKYDPSTISTTARTLAKHGLDHIVYAPAAGGRVTGVTASVVRDHLYTDHLPVVAEFGLTRRPAR